MTLEERVAAIISANIEKRPAVSPDQDLVKDLGVDSLARLMIVNALEDEFGVSIKDEDFKDVKTVRQIIDRLRSAFPGLDKDP